LEEEILLGHGQYKDASVAGEVGEDIIELQWGKNASGNLHQI